MVNLSRKVSLNKLNKQMVIKIANPGDKITHGEVCNKERSLLIIKPHSAVGGVAPNPKKERPASSIIIVPISKVAVIKIGFKIFGNICLYKICIGLLLLNLAAKIKFVVFKAKT